MSYRCLLVDDEPLARELLSQFVSQLPSLTLVDSCADALSALEVLHAQPVDLLLIDIKMPQMSGLELIRALSTPPALILTTAFAEHALEGFEVGAVDYLLKPFSFARFVRAVDRAINRSRPPGQAAAPVAPPAAAPAFVFLKVDRHICKVMLAEVLYWQAYGNYVKVIQRQGQPLLVTQTMAQLEKLLPPAQFVRVHKSYIVSLPSITHYQATTLSIGPVTLPIGDSYRNQFLFALNQAG